MAIREIRVFGDPILKTTCTEILEITKDVRSHLEDLLDTVSLDGRAGVASNQIGHSLRAFSLNINGETRAVINPKIISLDGDPELVGEGCLSLPDLWFEVPRYPRATVSALDIDGNEIVLEGEGLLAQALQHEIDHLNGKLYIDRLNLPERREALRQIRTAAWF